MAASRRSGSRMAVLCLLCALFAGVRLAAHPAPFSYIDIHVDQAGLTGRLVVHDLDAIHDLGLSSVDELTARLGEHGPALVALLQQRFRLGDGSMRIAWSATGVRPLEDRSSIEVAWKADGPPPGHLVVEAAMFPYDPAHQTFLNIYDGGRLTRQEVLDASKRRVEYYTGTRQGYWAVFTAFTASGVHHIAIGPDHILFIVGLLLLGGSLRRLLAIVTAFTVGHSVTLALATLQVVDPPARIVEPAIALSIVYVGADNLLVGRGSRDVRPWVALFFGLVHGFGFASVLRETGLPSQALGLSLFAFNVGVEIGQALIVVVVASALAAVRGRNQRLATALATAGSVVVVLAGAFWFVQRVGIFG